MLKDFVCLIFLSFVESKIGFTNQTAKGICLFRLYSTAHYPGWGARPEPALVRHMVETTHTKIGSDWNTLSLVEVISDPLG